MPSKFSKTLVSAAVAATIATTSVDVLALGLGRLNVTSALNSPFEGEIELLSVGDEDLQSLEISLATRSDFDRVGVERRAVLSLLAFEPSQRADGTPYVRVFSQDPINEPFLQFLVTARHPGGKSSREYTALLDPPLYANQSGAGETLSPNQPVISFESQDSTGRVTEVLPTPGTPSVSETLVGTPYQDGVITGSLDDGAAVTMAPAQAQGAMSGEQAAMYSGTEIGPTAEGDTLWKIAQSIDMSGGASLYQVMLAILRENPGAFINGNMNRLKTGQVLRLPDSQAISSLTNGEAREEYIAQLEAFESFRVAVSGSSATRITSSSMPAPTPSQPVPSDVSTSGSQSAEDLLRIVQANAGSEPNTSGTGKESNSADGARLKSQITALEEEVLSKDLETKELRERVKELESRMESAARLAQLENDTASRLQQQARDSQEREAREAEQRRLDEEARLAEQALENQKNEDSSVAGKIAAAATGAGAVVGGAAMKAGDAASDGIGKAADATGEMAGEVRDKARDIVGGNADKKVVIKKRPSSGTANTESGEAISTARPAAKTAEAGAANDGDDARARAEARAEKRREAQKAKRDAAAKAKAAGGVKRTPASQKPKGWFDKIKDAVTGTWPMILGLGGLVIGLLMFVVWRRRKSIAEFEESILSGSALDIQTDTQETTNSGTATDTSFLSEFGVPGMGTMQADEVDPIAEAEVYMAYGRDEQAEEVLKEAIARDGNRPELKLKLLEIYQQRNDLKEFETLAEELYPANGAADSDVWAKVVEMGQKLNPDNPLFKGGVLAAGAAAVSAAVAATGSGDSLDDDLDLDNDEMSPFPEPEQDFGADAALDDITREAEATHPKLDPFRKAEEGGDDDMSLDFDAASTTVDTTIDDAADSLQTGSDDLDFDLDMDSSGSDDDSGSGLGLGAAAAGIAAVGGVVAAGVASAGDKAADAGEGLMDGAMDLGSDAVGGLGDMAGGAMDMVSDGADSLGDTVGGALGLGGDSADESLDMGLDMDMSAPADAAGDALDLGDDLMDGALGDSLDMDMGMDMSADAGDLSLDGALGDVADDLSLDSGLSLDADDGAGDLSLDGDLGAGLGSLDGDLNSDLDAGLDSLGGDLDGGLDDLGDLGVGPDAGDLSLGLGDDAGGLSLDLDDDADLGDLSLDDAVSSTGSNVANIEDAATKLDLAKAYIDMGDKSGAQSIIDEVLEEGDDGQRAEAAELKAQIATG